MATEIRALTGVRGIGAVLIVIYHFGKVRLDFIHTLWPLPHGYMAVDLFFMLSGYVIALGYRDAFAQNGWTNFKAFFAKRIARLYPAYFVISLLYILKLALGLGGEETLARFSLYDIVGNALLLNGWGLHIYPLIGVAWAASAELGSYLLLPLLLIGIVQRGALAWALSVALALLAIVAISMSGLGYAGPLDVVEPNSLLPLLRAIAGFALGLAIYRYADRLDRLSGPVQDALVILVLIAIVLAACLTKNDLPLYGLLIPLVAILSRDGRVAQLLFGNRLVYHLGVISYSIYLLHPLFFSFTAKTTRYFGATELNFTLCFMVFFAVIWALSYASYLWVEMPGRKLLTSLLLPKPERPPAAPAQASA